MTNIKYLQNAHVILKILSLKIDTVKNQSTFLFGGISDIYPLDESIQKVSYQFLTRLQNKKNSIHLRLNHKQLLKSVL